MIQIVIAEDQELLLGVIGSLLNLEEDMKVVGMARNGEEAVTLVNQFNPDVCIFDLEMPQMNGLEAADALRSSGCRIIILTTFARTGYFERALKAGVNGYLLKDRPSRELVCSIRDIMDGKQIYSPDLLDDDSSDSEQRTEALTFLAEAQLKSEAEYKQRNIVRTAKNYFSTIIDKMKLRTG